ncbi:family with sequence similarity 122C [Phyllostomus discolor]|uniref:Family with sequence similarity 122C n=1 Tax=Phyllostomus discolor TaxID=89673 RepID=A0A834DR43_9CHIR|nr:family with sequence similarity 122C [Phyllostomus discolor]
MDMAQEKMELDVEIMPSLIITDDNILRRSNSAPLISELGGSATIPFVLGVQGSHLRTPTMTLTHI